MSKYLFASYEVVVSWVSVVVSSVVSIGVQAFLLCLFENLQVCPLGHSVVGRLLSAMNFRFIMTNPSFSLNKNKYNKNHQKLLLKQPSNRTRNNYDNKNNCKSSLCFLRRPQKLTKSSQAIWHYVGSVKSTVKISSILVAFLENTNFTYPNISWK